MPRRFLPLIFAFIVACTSPVVGDGGADRSPSDSSFLAATAEAPVTTRQTAPVSAPSTPTAAKQTPDPGAMEDSGVAALRHVQMLAGVIGPRVAGTPEERVAANYIADQFRAYGYEVEVQGFPYRAFFSRSAAARVIAPAERELRVATFTNSIAGTASGELYDARLGYPTDYPNGGIGGRIALVQRGELTFGDKLRHAMAAGAAGVLIYDPPNDVVAGTLTGTVPAIPILSIPGADGVRLREQLRAGAVRVVMSFDGGTVETEAYNVVARPQGGGCTAVVGGHYDTVPAAPGGSDNASGTAVVIEMARRQAQRGNPEGACFIAFGAEEEGLIGSQAYLAALTDAERRAIRFMLNFDMVAVGDEWLFIGSPVLQRRAQEIANEIGITGRRADLLGASSDHAAFIDRKIPALMLHRSDDRLLHTPQDTADRITAEPLATAVQLGLAFLSGFAQD